MGILTLFPSDINGQSMSVDVLHIARGPLFDVVASFLAVKRANEIDWTFLYLPDRFPLYKVDNGEVLCYLRCRRTNFLQVLVNDLLVVNLRGPVGYFPL